MPIERGVALFDQCGENLQAAAQLPIDNAGSCPVSGRVLRKLPPHLQVMAANA